MQCVKPCNLGDILPFQKIDERETGIRIIREMVIIYLRTLVLSKMFHAVAINLYQSPRRLSDFRRYIH